MASAASKTANKISLLRWVDVCRAYGNVECPQLGRLPTDRFRRSLNLARTAAIGAVADRPLPASAKAGLNGKN